MEIKDRIVKIINSEGISPSVFADMVGVQRSSISHILSGRNNPGLEILQKIIIGFPKYNADWLITGRGDVYKKPTQTNLFDAINEVNNKESIPDTVVNKPDMPSVSSSIPPIMPEPASNRVAEPPVITETHYMDAIEIEKIVIFYKNNTFKEYTPK